MSGRDPGPAGSGSPQWRASGGCWPASWVPALLAGDGAGQRYERDRGRAAGRSAYRRLPVPPVATAGNGDPVAVELPCGRVVELVTRCHPPPETIVNVALYNTSRAR